MGCDIHIVMERRETGSTEWVGVWASDRLPDGRPKIAKRDYEFFTQFGVRGRAATGVIYPRNLPKDVSRLAWLLYMRAPTDHHSASHASPAEFLDAWRRANAADTTVRGDFGLYDLLKLDGWDDGAKHRLVFWFDN